MCNRSIFHRCLSCVLKNRKRLHIINACLLSSEFWGILVKSGNLWQVWFRAVCIETAEAPLSNPSNQSESSYFSKLTCIIEVWRETYKYPTSPTHPGQLTLTQGTQGTRHKQDRVSFSLTSLTDPVVMLFSLLCYTWPYHTEGLIRQIHNL